MNELSPLDKKYRFSEMLLNMNLSVRDRWKTVRSQETLDIGWKLARSASEEELDRIDTEKVLNQYYQPTNIDLVEQAVSDAGSMME